MEPTKPKLPREAIELYNDFIHGEISRRAFMEGVQRLAGGLAAATVINALMPNYALGQQVSRTDDRIKANLRDRSLPKGQRKHQGISRAADQRRHPPETVTKLPGVIVVHENRGSEPAYRGHRAAVCPGQLHGICAGRTHLSGRLSGRRLQGRPDVQQDRQEKRCPRIWWLRPCG